MIDDHALDGFRIAISSPASWNLPFFKNSSRPDNVLDTPWRIQTGLSREPVWDSELTCRRRIETQWIESASGSRIGSSESKFYKTVYPWIVNSMNGATSLRVMWDLESIDCLSDALHAVSRLHTNVKGALNSETIECRRLSRSLEEAVKGHDSAYIAHPHAQEWYSAIKRVGEDMEKTGNPKSDRAAEIGNEDWSFGLTEIKGATQAKFELFTRQHKTVLFESNMHRADRRHLVEASLFARLIAQTVQMARKASSNSQILPHLAAALHILNAKPKPSAPNALDLIEAAIGTAAVKGAIHEELTGYIGEVGAAISGIRRGIDVLRDTNDRLSPICEPNFDRKTLWNNRRNSVPSQTSFDFT